MAAVVTVFLISMTNQLLSAVLGVYFTDINHSVLGAGIHLSIFAAGTLAGKLFLLFHRPVASKMLVRTGMGITAFACVGYLVGGMYAPFCSEAVWVSLCRMLQGIGFSLASSASPTLMTVGAKGQLSCRVSSYGMITTFAALTGNPLALQMYACMTKQKAFFMICLLVLICALTAGIWCPRTEEMVRSYQGFSVKGAGSGEKRLLPLISGLFLLFLISQILTSIYGTVIPIYANQAGKLELASVFLMVVTLSSLLIRIFIPVLLRKMGFRKLVITGCFLYASGIVCCFVPIAGYTGIIMILGGVLSGVASGIFMSVFHIEMLSAVPEDVYAKVNIIYLLAIDFSFIISGAFWSFTVNHSGIPMTFLVAILIVIFLGICCMVKLKSLCRAAE